MDKEGKPTEVGKIIKILPEFGNHDEKQKQNFVIVRKFDTFVDFQLFINENWKIKKSWKYIDLLAREPNEKLEVDHNTDKNAKVVRKLTVTWSQVKASYYFWLLHRHEQDR